MTFSRFLVLPAVLLALCCGCTGSKNPNAPAKLSGKVTYNNSPVTGGTIVLLTKDGALQVPIRPDGTFEGTDLPTGDLTVTISTDSLNPNKKTPTYGGAKGGAGSMSPVPQGASTTQGTYVRIPAKYSDRGSSGLKVTLARGNNKQDFNLTD